MYFMLLDVCMEIYILRGIVNSLNFIFILWLLVYLLMMWLFYLYVVINEIV